MRPVIAALMALLFIAAPALAQVNVGDTPAMAFVATDGTKVDIAALKGKLVLIDFWATWCGPCMNEAGHMVEVNNKYREQGLQIIGISLDDNKAALQNVAKEKGFNWPQYFDGQGWGNKFAKAWGVKGIPRTALLDTSGAVVWIGHPAAMDKPIADAFQKTPPVLVDPSIVAAASATLDEVEASLASGDQKAAIKKFAAVPPEAMKDGKIKQRAGDAQTKLESAAAEMLAAVEPLIEEKKFIDASARLQELVALRDSSVAKKAAERLSQVNAMPEAKAQIEAARKAAAADEALLVAQRMQTEKKDDQAYVRFKEIVQKFPDTEAAAKAGQAVKTYEQNPAFVKQANETAAGGKAKGMLSLAQSYRTSGRKDLAKKKYQEVITTFPGTSFAETAKRELAAMDG